MRLVSLRHSSKGNVGRLGDRHGDWLCGGHGFACCFGFLWLEVELEILFTVVAVLVDIAAEPGRNALDGAGALMRRLRWLFLFFVSAQGAIKSDSFFVHASFSKSAARYQARQPRLQIGRRMPESMSLVICFAVTPRRAMTSRRRRSFMRL